MSFTYNIAVSTDIDKVRFNIGDTNSSDYQLEDEEITYLLTLGSVTHASIQACYMIAARYASKVDEGLSDHSKTYSQLQTHYTQLARRLSQSQSMNIAFSDCTESDAVFTRELP